MIISTNHPTIAVVMTTFNDETRVALALRALADQRRAPNEVVLVDDHSSDDTLGHLHRFAIGHSAVKVLALPSNIGVARARNEALRVIRSEYVLFVDSDDQLLPGAIEELAAAARRSNADMLMSRASAWDEFLGRDLGILDHRLPAGHYSGEQIVGFLALGELHAYLWNKLIRVKLFDNLDFKAMSSQSDLEIMPRLAIRASLVEAIDAATYRYTVRSGSITNSKSQTAANVLECLRSFEEVYAEAGRVLPHFTRIWLRLRAVHAAIASGQELQPFVKALRASTGFLALKCAWGVDKKTVVMAFGASRLTAIYVRGVHLLRRIRGRR